MKPSKKMGSAGVAGALTAIVVWCTQEFAGVTVPGEIASSVTVVIMFGVGYFVKEPKEG